MATTYDAALAELYQTPHGSFVDERKRLAAELKAAGDKSGAATLAKRARPTISAWVVNQLWWHARDAFSILLASASRLRDGDLAATSAHRDALAKLRTRAAAILSDAGHAATESTLRRVAQTLAAIAATGSWEPDPPGALAADRDPPGFDAAMLAPAVASDGAEAALRVVAATERSRRKAIEVAAAAVAAREKLEHEVESEPPDEAPVIPIRTPAPPPTPPTPPPPDLAAALRAAKAELAAKELAAEQLRTRLAEAKAAIEKARAVVHDLESQLDDA
jgi:hypothetical protein